MWLLIETIIILLAMYVCLLCCRVKKNMKHQFVYVGAKFAVGATWIWRVKEPFRRYGLEYVFLNCNFQIWISHQVLSTGQNKSKRKGKESFSWSRGVWGSTGLVQGACFISILAVVSSFHFWRIRSLFLRLMSFKLCPPYSTLNL